MLDSAAPLEQRPPVKVLPVTFTGWSRNWSSTRIAAPPRSGPVLSQRLRVNVEFTTESRPPRTNTAPPPPPSSSDPVELPRVKVRLRSTSLGVAWSLQCDVVHTSRWSQVFW